MANELFVYNLFRNILAKSQVIEGRFAILHGVAADVNATDWAQLITDAFDGLIVTKKYPCVIMQPPYEIETVTGRGQTTMRFDMFFLTLHQRTGDGDIKSKDRELNRSLHTKEMDWKDMRECAAAFRAKLREICRNPPVSRVLGEEKNSKAEYKRLTAKGNDNLNGIWMCFDMVMNIDQCETADYPEGTEIEIPEDFSPHPLHKH